MIVKTKKYDTEKISIILQLKDYPKMTQKKAVNVLKDKHNILIGKTTLAKIWNNEYV